MPEPIATNLTPASGLRDAANLAWKLAAVLDGRASDTLLDSYEAGCRPHATALIRKAIMIGNVMTGTGTAARLVRVAAMPLAARIPPIERKILSSRSPALATAITATRRPHRLAGALLPRVELGSAPHEATVDRLLNATLHLISVDGAGPANAPPLPTVLLAAAGGLANTNLAPGCALEAPIGRSCVATGQCSQPEAAANRSLTPSRTSCAISPHRMTPSIRLRQSQEQREPRGRIHGNRSDDVAASAGSAARAAVSI